MIALPISGQVFSGSRPLSCAPKGGLKADHGRWVHYGKAFPSGEGGTAVGRDERGTVQAWMWCSLGRIRIISISELRLSGTNSPNLVKTVSPYCPSSVSASPRQLPRRGSLCYPKLHSFPAEQEAPSLWTDRAFVITARQEGHFSPSSSWKISSFCFKTESSCPMYCSGNLGLWKRVRCPSGRLTLVMPPPPRERMVWVSSIM